jgi:hypothetical protein
MKSVQSFVLTGLAMTGFAILLALVHSSSYIDAAGTEAEGISALMIFFAR